MNNVAIIGAGGIGVVHLHACGALPDVRVTWVADADPERARTLAAEAGARATTDNAEAIGAADVDAVIVAVPTPFHRPVTELAAAHGKHVFCEKPMARTVADAEAMIAACDRGGVRLMIGQVVRFFPEYARIHDILADGTLGRIGVARISRVGSGPVGSRSWFLDLEQSGGMVVDFMIHDLDTLRWYFGDVARLYALGLSYTPLQATSDYAQAVLRFESGVIAHVEASWAHATFRTTVEIAGEHGLVRHDSDQSAPLRVDQPAHDDRPPTVTRRGAWPYRPYEAELRNFFDRLADGQPFLTDGEEGRRSLDVALAVLASVRTGRPVRFADGRALSV